MHKRCPWVRDDPIYQHYHDFEWGVPQFDDKLLFELLILEGAQAGLSWITILRKRENYRAALDNFDAHKIAQYDADKLAELMQNAGIVRNRLKIQSLVLNAQGFLAIQQEFGSFATFIWSFVGDQPIQNHWQNLSQIPTRSPESDAMSLALKKRGFKFVGTTICYAFMQATGMVNDHVDGCFRRGECAENATIAARQK